MRPGALPFVAALLLAASAAAAQPTATEIERAKDLFARAEKAEASERWREARDLLEQVLAIKETPGIVFHKANCEEKLGELTAALSDFERAEALATAQGKDDVRDLAAPRIAALRPRIPKITLRLPPGVTGASVRVDGAPVAAEDLGTARPVDPGAHTVEAVAPGREPFSKKLELRERDAAVVEIALPPAAAPEPVASGADASPAGGGVPTASIALGAGGVALLAGGFVAFAIAGGENADGEAACAAPASCDPGVRDSVQTLDRVALGLWIGGAVCAGAAFTLWAVAPSTSSPAPATAVRAGPRGVWVEGSF